MKMVITILATMILLLPMGCGFIEETNYIGAEGGGTVFSPTPFYLE